MPIVLPLDHTPLFQQVIRRLKTDTDPTAGLVPALGDGVNSIYPRPGAEPDADPTLCPRPFVIAYPYGRKPLDKAARQGQVLIEVHDDSEMGYQRWPGILERIYFWLQVQEWRPTNDAIQYLSGLYLLDESPESTDDRYGTTVVQILLGCLQLDRTSNHGYNG